MAKAMWIVGGLFLTVFVLGSAFWIGVAQAVDTPDYAVVKQDGDIEIRDYPTLRVAEIVKEGNRRQAVRKGFRPLASYIFAKNRPGEKIAMTAPVTQSESEGAWLVHFIMPEGYALKDLPQPTDTDVRLKELPAQRRVAIRFSGRQTDELVAQKEAALRAWIEENGVTTIGAPTYAYYNDPFTPGFLRRNEVLFDIVQ